MALYDTTKIGKLTYQMFLAMTGDIDKVMLDSDDIESMSKFRGGTELESIGATLTVSNSSPAIIYFTGSTNCAVTYSATDGLLRYLVNLGTGTITIGAISLTTNESATTTNGLVATIYKTPYIPIGACESGMNLKKEKGETKKLSTGDELVINSNNMFNASVFGANDWLSTILVNKICSIGMVQLGVEAGVFIKNIYPNTELNFISNDVHTTNVIVKAENALIELVG